MSEHDFRLRLWGLILQFVKLIGQYWFGYDVKIVNENRATSSPITLHGEGIDVIGVVRYK